MNKINESDLLYCRLCLKNDRTNQNLIDVVTNDHSIHKKIVKIFQFSLDQDNFSPYICLLCREKVTTTMDFIESVHKNQDKLRKIGIEGGLNVKQESLGTVLEILDPMFDDKSFQFYPVEFSDVKCENEGLDETKLPKTGTRKSKRKSIDKVFVCDICSKPFKLKTLLVSHMTSKHISKSSFECDQCERSFQTANGLATHKGQGHDSSVDISHYLLCELCEDRPTFDTFNDMADHYQSQHSTRGYVKCCNKKLHTKRSVMYHAEAHLRPFDFMCTECQKIFPNKYTLKSHMARHKPEEEKKHECHICQRKFHLEYDKILHVRHVHEKKEIKEERAVCVECNKTFSSKISLYLHNRRFHMNLPQPICESCGKRCRSDADLRSHIKARHTETIKSKCDICGNMVKNMKKHQQIHVESQLNIKCDICGHETTTFKYLRLHMKIHSDEKPYVCSTCGQSFKRKKALNDHMSLHSGIPRHFCNYCDRTFNNSGNKFKHTKQAHPIEAAKNRRHRTLKQKMEESTGVEPVIIQFQVDLNMEQKPQ